MDARTDIAALRAVDPELADPFNSVREELDFPRPEIPIDFGYATDSYELTSSRRMKLGDQFTDLLDQIRKIPGLENFLDGPSEDELKILALRGPLSFSTS